MQARLINTASLPGKYYIILKYDGSKIPFIKGCSDNLIGAQTWLNTLCQFSKDVLLGTVPPKYGIVRDVVFLHKGVIIMRAYESKEFTIHGATYRIHRADEIKEHFICSFITGTILDVWLSAHAT